MNYDIYPDSVRAIGKTKFFLARCKGKKVLVIQGTTGSFPEFSGIDRETDGIRERICDLSNENCKALQKLFPFTLPVCHKGRPVTIGLGDRLGIASPGHIRAVKDLGVFPVLAQQSIRELNLTGRTYEDVICAASWAVFQEGYTKGFGADGDHLKKPEEITAALDAGCTMITLDCSEHIDNTVANLASPSVSEKYSGLSGELVRNLESKYAGRCFRLKDGSSVHFDADEFKKILLVYLKAVEFAKRIYHAIIRPCGRSVDFELSIDETMTPTSPESHYFIASELTEAGVEITSLAPRFCGEFQKGIDYRGNLDQFEREFSLHVSIAEHFGYKISVHSGSDKFSVFPSVNRLSGGRYHVKTAGTNWLEAVRIIAQKNPSLYRRMHAFAFSVLDEAKKYYHISAIPANVPPLGSLDDRDLPGLMDLDDSRQILHITYGLILNAKDEEGGFLFRNEFFDTLSRYEADYYAALEKHIGKHLRLLGAAG